jgi:hypothetical protein
VVAFEAKVRKWGNSMGVIIPSDVVASERLRPGDRVRLVTARDSTAVLKELWGAGKGIKISAQEFKDELRRNE